MLRSIILLPKLDNLGEVQSIREKYDPLAKCIAPHVTLLFPFESDLSNQALEQHLNKVLKGIKKFEVEFKDITGDMRDGYLFLNIKKGNDQIIELHDKLYSGELKEFLNRKITYCPHLTVGRVDDEIIFNNAVEELSTFHKSFITEIEKVYVEVIDENDNSIIQFSYDLE